MHASRTVVARILKLLLSEHALTICFVNLVRTYSQSPPYDGFNPGFDTLVFTSFAIFWHRSTHIIEARARARFGSRTCASEKVQHMGVTEGGRGRGRGQDMLKS